MTTWNVVPMDSTISELCSKGNVNAVKGLISEGRASVLDVDPDGRTLLDVSINTSCEEMGRADFR